MPGQNNQRDLINVIVQLATVFKEEMSRAMLDAYVEDLSEYPFESVVIACKKARRTLKFFPRISELLEMVPDSDDAWVGYITDPKHYTAEAIEARGDDEPKYKTITDGEIKELLEDNLKMIDKNGRVKEG